MANCLNGWGLQRMPDRLSQTWLPIGFKKKLKKAAIDSDMRLSCYCRKLDRNGIFELPIMKDDKKKRRKNFFMEI